MSLGKRSLARGVFFGRGVNEPKTPASNSLYMSLTPLLL